MNKLKCLAGATMALLVSANAWSASTPPVISVGTNYLIPNLAGQTIPIRVSGTTQVGGVDFDVEIAGGGTANGGTAGPSITNVDLITGTIFAGDNTGQQNLTTFPSQAYAGGVPTNFGTTVQASGLLATLTVSTVGYTGTAFSLKLTGFQNGAVSGNTDFGTDNLGNPIAANVTNGYVVAAQLGDADLSGSVNIFDLNTLLANYNRPGIYTWASGDFTGDGKVDIFDLNDLLANYNRPGVTFPPSAEPAAGATPEPASAALVAMAATMLLRSRRRSSI